MSDSLAQAGSAPAGKRILPNADERAKLRRKRAIKDGISRYGIGAAGIGVVFALGLIFVYLFSEVVPMFKSATYDTEQTYTLPGLEQGEMPVHLMLERYNELSVTFTDTGRISFFETESRRIRLEGAVPASEGASLSSFGAAKPTSGMVAYGYSDGTAGIVQVDYDLSYPDDTRYIQPKVNFPLGEEPLVIDEAGRSLQVIAVQPGSADITQVAAVTEDGRVVLTTLEARTNMMTGETSVRQRHYDLGRFEGQAQHILLNDRFRHLYIADERGRIHHYAVHDLNNIRRYEIVDVAPDSEITAMAFLNGTVSVIVGTADGQVSQWIPVRNERNEYNLTRLRGFKTYPGAITAISPEHTRKGFWVGDDQGNIGAHHGTASADLLFQSIGDKPVELLVISPRNRMLLSVDSDHLLARGTVWNEHPETSFSTLWSKVWYEGRSQPEYIWQASSGSNEFEPKMSLVPLTLGTLKAAFYAMLFAIPLAVGGAIYTAYFMSPKLRGKVKPTIEIMEALPTVILGFLAGLWLAPFLEGHLPAVFSILLLLPIAMLVFGYCWSLLPANFRTLVPDGWEAVLLVPVILFLGWFCVTLSPFVEIWFFNGSARQWLTDVGITYDQRNALVVGIAMGFAVIPTIFSIAEDAIFNVPRHLTQGSLALGASTWQTMVGVVLPTASPGIFSAVMMGFGRAVGETMIVLMATGNSPIMNFNIFEGMRTLSANIAVELPETAVGSSHFRVLFLAAVVLLLMTFVVNTVAEIVRQRLRAKYSSL